MQFVGGSRFTIYVSSFHSTYPFDSDCEHYTTSDIQGSESATAAWRGTQAAVSGDEDDAAATRVAAAAATDVRVVPMMGAISTDAYGDDPLGRAFVAAIVRVYKRSCEVAPQDRIAALRTRICAWQQPAPRCAEP